MLMLPTEGKGDWALITGASSGIGREFAVQLAAAGMNVVLVARRRERLTALQEELTQRHKVRSICVALDLGRANAAGELKERMEEKGIRVRLLCNNAAFGRWGHFDATDAQTYEKIVQLAAATPIALCQVFLPDLTSFAHSAIVNVSSPAAFQPVPYLAVYASAKACLHHFSLALYGELKERGVLVQTLVPGPTATEFDTIAGAYPCGLKEERRPAGEVVAVSLAHLGKDVPLVTTHKGTYKQRVFAAVFPVRTVLHIVGKMFRPPVQESQPSPLSCNSETIPQVS